MVTNISAMACGACGSGNFRVYQDDKTLLIECNRCKSVSIIKPAEPKLEIAWGVGDGVLCNMDPDD